MSNKKMTYEKAISELQGLVNQMNDPATGIDDLSERVKRAAELITFCKEKLRNTEDEVNQILGDNALTID